MCVAMLGTSYNPICFKLQHFVAYAPEFNTTNIIDSLDADETDVFSTKQLFRNFSALVDFATNNNSDTSLKCSLYTNNRAIITSLFDYATFTKTINEDNVLDYLGDDATGNINDIAISSLTNLVCAMEYCAMEWLGDEFYP